ncbi:MAG: 16S rRNA (uracil(1498)-N(3))-methyltransferase [Candidatus Ancaeobacter aquaticus]|nr:16S rRNA (uracil(1498)-N(3))-methyltransferase [Candidatus Ancaeobacter aquaticus]
MSHKRIHIPADIISEHPLVVPLDATQVNYLINVLRLKQGDSITVFDGEGCEYDAYIDECGDNAVAAKIVKKRECETNAESVYITVAVALAKGKKMSLIVQKLTEIGVDVIVPLVTKRTVVQVKDDEVKKEKWKKVAIEAAKQCGRADIPAITEIMEFSDYVHNKHAGGMKLIAYESGKTLLKSIMQEKQVLVAGSVCVVVGPEGGFEKSEIAQAQENGFQEFSFGETILRTETAAIAAALIIKYETGF